MQLTDNLVNSKQSDQTRQTMIDEFEALYSGRMAALESRYDPMPRQGMR